MQSSAEDVRESARKLVPLLREQAELTEALLRVSPVAMKALVESGLLRLLQPSAYGGKEENPALLIEVLQTLGRGCLSTAWVGFRFASHVWMLTMWPVSVQDAIWRPAPDVLIGSCFADAAASAVRLPDASGYCFSGVWEFVTGIDDAAYVMLGARSEPGCDGKCRTLIGIVPRASLEVIDGPGMLGLCGTGNRSVGSRGVVVRDDWVIEASSLSDCAAPGLMCASAPVFRMPVTGLLPHLASAVLLGNAQGCYDEFITGARARRTTHSRLPPDQFVAQQMHVAEAQALIISGTLLIQGDAEQAAVIAKRGEPAPAQLQGVWRMHAAHAARLATRAVDLLFAAYGGGGNFLANNAQRRFRDTHAAISHELLAWEAVAAEFGSQALSGCTRAAPDSGRPAGGTSQRQ
ncbi:hypothetical protein [Paraburkholderia sacchari]|uniref:hypothetical protein n=1 Tax=Paraburkholderia sacchari TaxID=159450 RepID=UPI003D993376